MNPSIHDNLLISYEVQCETRTITLRTKTSGKDEPTEFVNVVFIGVQGYRFENDAFGNIIFGLDIVSAERFLAEYSAEISESYRSSGSPGPWAANPESALAHLQKQGTHGFILSSSYGLSGWVLAQDVSIFSADKLTSAIR
jgi:hypothetical protein